MPPTNNKKFPPVAVLNIVSIVSRVVTVSTIGSTPGSTGQNRPHATPSTYASWEILWGDGTSDLGTGDPPASSTHTYAGSVAAEVTVQFVVVSSNTLRAIDSTIVAVTADQPPGPVDPPDVDPDPPIPPLPDPNPPPPPSPFPDPATTVTVQSIVLGLTSPTNLQSLTWLVQFTVPVTGVTAGAFTLTATGPTGTSITSVTQVNTSLYRLTADRGTGNGSLRANFTTAAGITAITGGTAASGTLSGQTYTIVSPPVASANNTQVPPTGSIIDGSLRTWTLSGTTVSVNGAGQPAPFSPAVSILYWNGAVYLEQSNGQFMALDGTFTQDPRLPPAPPTPPTPPAPPDPPPPPPDPPICFFVHRVGTTPVTGPTTVQWLCSFSDPVTGVTLQAFTLQPINIGNCVLQSVVGSLTDYTITAQVGAALTGGGFVGCNLTTVTGILSTLTGLQVAAARQGDAYAVDFVPTTPPTDPPTPTPPTSPTGTTVPPAPSFVDTVGNTWTLRADGATIYTPPGGTAIQAAGGFAQELLFWTDGPWAHVDGGSTQYWFRWNYTTGLWDYFPSGDPRGTPTIPPTDPNPPITTPPGPTDPPTQPPQIPPGPSPDGILSQTDLVYLGSFDVPNDLNGYGNAQAGAQGNGLTIRYVDGIRYLMSTGQGPTIAGMPYRMTIPPLRTAAPYNQSTIVKVYGNIYSGKRIGPDFNPLDGSQAGPCQILWDEATQRLLWVWKVSPYIPGGPYPSLGVSTLNEGTGVAGGSGVGLASYGFVGTEFKCVSTGIIPIPADFANTYLGGRRFGVGSGGYNSNVASGDCSMGPSIFAIDPPSGSHLSNLANTQILGYQPAPGSGVPAPGFGRMTRPASVAALLTTPMDGWGVQKFMWTDYLYGGGAWLTNAARDGVVFPITFGHGLGTYQDGTFGLTGWQTWWVVYDPADLARVAQGTLARYDAQPVGAWPMEYPGVVSSFNFPATAITGLVTGVSGDGTFATGRLYVPCNNHGITVDGTWVAVEGLGNFVSEFTYGYGISAFSFVAAESNANLLTLRHSQSSLRINGSSVAATQWRKMWNDPHTGAFMDTQMHGMCYDQTDQTIWVGMINANWGGLRIHCWQVTDGGGGSPGGGSGGGTGGSGGGGGGGTLPPVTTGPLVGAIRFDEWSRTAGLPASHLHELTRLETEVAIRYRLPYYANVSNPTVAVVDEAPQSVVDQDILYASNAGIHFFIASSACSYSNYFIEGMKVSPYRDRMKLASAVGSTLDCRLDKVISHINAFGDQYLKVLGGRPVLFVLTDSYIASTDPGDVAGTPATIAALRARIVAEAGGANPYLIGQDFTAASAAANAAYLGLDAISSYGGGLDCVTGTVPYSVQVACEESKWPVYKNTGWPYIPTVTTGWDGTPTASNFFTSEATPSEIANHLTNALAFAAANPASNPANLLVISAWNEFTEGHYLSPYNPATNATGAGRVNAIAAVLV